MSALRNKFGEAMSRVFPALKPDLIELLVEKVALVHIKAGEVLYRQGEPGDGMHILHTGRIQIKVELDEGQSEEMVGIMKPGEVVGEISLFTEGARSATVIATRDSTLGYLAREYFDATIAEYPEIKVDIANFIIDRLIKARGKREEHFNQIRTIALVPLDEGFDIEQFSKSLQIALLRFGSTALIDPPTVESKFSAGLGEVGREEVAELERHLDRAEEANDFVLLTTDPASTRWTSKCVTYADAVVFVAPISTPVSDASALVSKLAGVNRDRITVSELVLIHGRQTKMPRRTISWLNEIPVERHHHVRSGTNKDFGRLARIISGNSVSLILGGGGARGFAHIGVIRALREAGIPIDMIGGTSQGAIVAAGVAMGWNDAQMLEEYRAAYVDDNPGNDYTLPVFSIIKGAKMTKRLRRHFGDVLIEDLWIPFFAVSSNLSNGQEKIHRTGPVWHSLRASASLPAFLPPVIEDSEILVDGSILNSLPINVAKNSMGGYMIVVDIPTDDEFLYEKESIPTAWEYIRSRLLANDVNNHEPTLQRVVLKSTMLGSRREAEVAKDLADLFISPPVQKFDMLDWSLMFDICEAGYHHCKKSIAEWATRHSALIQHEEINDLI